MAMTTGPVLLDPAARRRQVAARYGARSAYLEGRASVTSDERLRLARDAYVEGYIDVWEFERRVGEALGVR
jgi:hypothetical protein